MEKFIKFIIVVAAVAGAFFVGNAYFNMQEAAVINDTSKLEFVNKIDSLQQELEKLKEVNNELNYQIGDIRAYVDSSKATYIVKKVFLVKYGDDRYRVGTQVEERIPYPNGDIYTNTFRFVRQEHDADWYHPDVPDFGSGDINVREESRLHNLLEVGATKILGKSAARNLDDLVYQGTIRDFKEVAQPDTIYMPLIEVEDQFHNRTERIFELIKNNN